MKTTFFSRYAWWILLAFAMATPFLLWEAKAAVESNTNKVQDWIPKTFAETGELAWFRQHFVADQFVAVSWEGCELGGDPSLANSKPDDPRIEQLAQLLVPDETSNESGAYRKYFKTVVTARRILKRITSPPSSVPYAEAVERLRGFLIGPDGKSTAIVVTLTDEAVKDFRTAIGRGVQQVLARNHKQGALLDALNQCGIRPEDVRLGGPPVDNVSIDEEGDRTMTRLVVLAAMFGLCLAWISLRSIKLTLIVLACGLLSAIAGLALVELNGDTTDAVVLSMPSLLYILAISGSIHLINYYREEVAERGLAGAPERALGHGWRPALFCNVTTAIGLGSLYSSEIVPIRKFGMYSAGGVIAMLVILFLYLPAALQAWPVEKKRSHLPAKEDYQSSGVESWLDRIWLSLGSWIIRRHVWVALTCVLGTVLVSLGLSRVRTQIDLLKLFHPDARILHDYAWLEDRLGRLVPMEIVVRFSEKTQGKRAAADDPPDVRLSRLTFLERMEFVSLVQRAIEQRLGAAGTDVIGQSMSAATFAPEIISERADTLSFAKRSGFNSRLEASRDAFERSGFLQVDANDGAELWRISVRVAAFRNVDYGAFVRELRQTVEPVLAAHRARIEVLQKIEQTRSNGRYAGASVLMWSNGGPAELAASDTAQQQHLFRNALQDLLNKVRLRVSVHDVDPASVPLTRLRHLRDYDCVVLAGGFSDADTRMIQNNGGKVVDTRRSLAKRMAADSQGSTLSSTTPLTDVAAVYTGVVPIVYKAQRSLLDSLIASTFWSFVTITPLMWLVARSISAGSVAMLPNILPVLFVFGSMGWLGFAVDIGSMMSASIALGVAVDDTIHFMTWFRDGLDKSGDRKSAILLAYRRCATPTTQASLVNGLGLAVFATSTFMPTRKFGWLMLVILFAGLVAELVLLPAILAGPLGRVFRPRTRREASGKSTAAATSHTKVHTGELNAQRPHLVSPIDDHSKTFGPSPGAGGARHKQ